MKIYHGSLEIIKEPKILQPTRTLDYGSGFYTTTSFEQAEKWVFRKMQKGIDYGFVSSYKIEEEELNNLKVLRFEKPNDNWIDFVEANRQDESFTHDYDIVYGPVADDKVYAQFALYEQGFIDREVLIRELKTYKLVDQLLFHTERSLNCLHYIDFKQIDKI